MELWKKLWYCTEHYGTIPKTMVLYRKLWYYGKKRCNMYYTENYRIFCYGCFLIIADFRSIIVNCDASIWVINYRVGRNRDTFNYLKLNEIFEYSYVD